MPIWQYPLNSMFIILNFISRKRLFYPIIMIHIERNATLGILNGAYFALSPNCEGACEGFPASRVTPGDLERFCTANSCGCVNFTLYRKLMKLCSL